MTPPAIVQQLDQFAAEINRVLAIGEQFGRQGAEAYRRAGLLFIGAKEKCDHGEWGKWLSEHVHVSDRQARNYMALARTAVTSDLYAAWRTICGNDDDDDQGLSLPGDDDKPTTREALEPAQRVEKWLERVAKLAGKAEAERPRIITMLRQTADSLEGL